MKNNVINKNIEAQDEVYDKSMSFHIYDDSVKKKEIEHGIKNIEFKVSYQANISKDGVLIGVEALIRWFKSDSKILPPSEFIDFAERNGLIISISEIVVDEVCSIVNYLILKGY